MRYEQESLILRPGDVLVSYSDGISEVVNPQGQMWDDEALQILLWENRRRTARQLIDFILEVADRYASGADQHDDMTATILKVG
jgi:sigma-B regulation protein RsbU (phosphoserine phosphatase)